MFPLSGQLVGGYSDVVIKQTLKIKVDTNDFFKHICLQCLAKIDLVLAVQNQFQLRNAHYLLLKQWRRPLEFMEVMLEEESEDLERVEYDWEPVSEPETEKVSEPIAISPKKERAPHIRKHESVTTLSSRTCYLCSDKAEFQSKDELVTHLAESHAGQTEYICTICEGKTFPWVAEYNHHLSRHDEERRPLKCNFCPIRFSTETARRKHENEMHGMSHKLPKPPKPNTSRAQCEICGLFFKTLRYALRHMEVKHGQGKLSECKFCHKKYGSSKSMASHMMIHTGEKPYKCDVCSKQYRTQSERRKHAEIEHKAGTNIYKCGGCRMTFQEPLKYYQHVNTVHHRNPFRIRNYSCLLCAAKPQNPSELREHIYSEHSMDEYPRVQCSLCSTSFLSAQQLQSHKRYKHAERQPEPVAIQCAHCDKKHYTELQMQKHMANEHGAEKKFECEICGRRFILRRSMRKHVKTHRKEHQRLKCNLCDATFALKGAIYEHWRTEHANQPMSKKTAVAANCEENVAPS
ncbi:zinc finger protein 260-like isoform X2 [Wyeomyia smithii]|nr:zinc finger protein 260-like isoform X2 [Wyeomyia smithii]